MLGNYFPVLLFVCIGIAMGVVPVVLGKLVSPHRPYSEKLSHMNVVSRLLKMRA